MLQENENMAAGSHASLDSFRALDVNHNGVLSFDEYLTSLYPLATKQDMKVMKSWAMPEKVSPTQSPNSLSYTSFAVLHNHCGGTHSRAFVLTSWHVVCDPDSHHVLDEPESMDGYSCLPRNETSNHAH